MKQLIGVCVWLGFLFILSCDNVAANKRSGQTQNDKSNSFTDTTLPDKKISVNRNKILKDFMTWYNYTYYNVNIAQEFIGLDLNSDEITKNKFLTKLTTGSFVAFRIGIKNNMPVYQLYPLNVTNTDIQATIKQAALHELSNDAMEGKGIPDFSFTDIHGNIYNKTNTQGKIIVLKCWFIHCVACIAEFPKLNKLVNDYKQNKNVLFISLATDSQPDLITFLKTKQFNYAVVSDQTKYINDLNINMFPTHILIDANGKIVKTTNDIDDLIPSIKKEVGNSN